IRMKPRQTALLATLSLWLAYSSGLTAETFSAIQVRLTGQGLRRVSIVVDRYMSNGDATLLLDKATHEGLSSALSELRRSPKGLVSMTGTESATVYAAVST